METSKTKICIIIPYFGKLPTTVDLWLKSCEWNKNINFLVYSDVKKENVPDNVLWITEPFKKFKALAKSKLDMKIKLDTPYECCDFKAVYGIIFEDYLQGYDYWGFCDMDMVFGDLEWFFKKYNLELYDKFHAWGHLTLFRNTKENNNRFRLPCTEGMGYKDAFVTGGSTHFCEHEINQIYHMYGFPFFDQRICADITPACKRMKIGGQGINYDHQVFFWQNGKVWRAYLAKTKTWKGIEVEEFAYIHFQKRKMAPPAFDVRATNRFFIASDGFPEKREISYPTLSRIDEVNPYKGALYEKLEYLQFQIKRLQRRLKMRHKQ